MMDSEDIRIAEYSPSETLEELTPGCTIVPTNPPYDRSGWWDSDKFSTDQRDESGLGAYDDIDNNGNDPGPEWFSKLGDCLGKQPMQFDYKNMRKIEEIVFRCLGVMTSEPVRRVLDALINELEPRRRSQFQYQKNTGCIPTWWERNPWSITWDKGPFRLCSRALKRMVLYICMLPCYDQRVAREKLRELGKGTMRWDVFIEQTLKNSDIDLSGQSNRRNTGSSNEVALARRKVLSNVILVSSLAVQVCLDMRDDDTMTRLPEFPDIIRRNPYGSNNMASKRKGTGKKPCDCCPTENPRYMNPTARHIRRQHSQAQKASGKEERPRKKLKKSVGQCSVGQVTTSVKAPHMMIPYDEVPTEVEELADEQRVPCAWHSTDDSGMVQSGNPLPSAASSFHFDDGSNYTSSTAYQPEVFESAGEELGRWSFEHNAGLATGMRPLECTDHASRALVPYASVHDPALVSSARTFNGMPMAHIGCNIFPPRQVAPQCGQCEINNQLASRNCAPTMQSHEGLRTGDGSHLLSHEQIMHFQEQCGHNNTHIEQETDPFNSLFDLPA